MSAAARGLACRAAFILVCAAIALHKAWLVIRAVADEWRHRRARWRPAPPALGPWWPSAPGHEEVHYEAEAVCRALDGDVPSQMDPDITSEPVYPETYQPEGGSDA
jgi:hypothetical protein